MKSRNCLGVVLLWAVSIASLQAAELRRVHLRNDARLIQTTRGDSVHFRCERMGGSSGSAKRWVRDCNTLARLELESMKRAGQLGQAKLERDPMGTAPVNDELVATLPLPPSGKDGGPIAGLESR